MIRTAALLVSLLVSISSAMASEPELTTVESTATVSADQERCLVHTVRELGMSAKQKLDEQVWIIGPQFLHPSIVEDGAVDVRVAQDKSGAIMVARARWKGPLKKKEDQAEIEQRLLSIANMMSLACGAPPNAGKCTAKPAGGKSGACEHAR